ncbi:MAG: MFS transporter [Myxococcota bacterium]
MSGTSTAAALPRPAASIGLKLLYGLTFVFIGGYGNFFPLWLRDIGWSEPAIGWLDGARYGCLLVFPLMWGRLADHWGDGVRVLRVLTLGGLVAFLPVLWTEAFWPVMAALVTYSAFRVAHIPALDSVTLSHVERTGEEYGRYRIWGSAGFIVGGLALGAVVEGVGRVAIPWGLVGTLAATWLLVLSLSPESRGGLAANPQPGRIRRLLADRDLRALYLVGFGSRLVAQGLYGFLALHLVDLGVADAIVPVYWAIGVVSEIILIRVRPRLFGGRSTRAVLAFVFLAMVAQYGLTAVIREPLLVAPVMILHGITFGIWYVTSVQWLGDHVPPVERATAQALFQTTGFGVGGMLSAIGAGYLFHLGQGRLMFGVAAAVAAVFLLATWRWFPR